MNTFKNVLLFVFGGALLGDLLGTLMGRSLIPWWHTPGEGSIVVQSKFPDTAVNILGELMRFQLIGAAIGAVVGLVLAILVVRAQKRRAPAATLPATSTTPTAPKP